MVIFLAIFILMTLLFLYGSNNVNDAIYAPFHVASNHPLKITDLKKWGGKDGYVSFYGNKVLEGYTLECEWCVVDAKPALSEEVVHCWKLHLYLSCQ